MEEELRTKAQQLRPLLKPCRGPTPDVPYIKAAILLARDPKLGARAACRLAGADEIAGKSRVSKLAKKVQLLPSNETAAFVLPRSRDVTYGRELVGLSVRIPWSAWEIHPDGSGHAWRPWLNTNPSCSRRDSK